MPRGGYQKPTNGAVVSPPGALSKRKAVENNAKENIPSGGGYGERKAMQQQMSGAPIAKSEPVRNLSINVSPTSTAGKEKLGSLTDPTQRPEEAITNGMSFGEGLRPTDIGLPMGTGQPDFVGLYNFLNILKHFKRTIITLVLLGDSHTSMI